jgi:hypothetical protein
MVHTKTSQGTNLQLFRPFFRVPVTIFSWNVEITVAKHTWYTYKEFKSLLYNGL